MRGLLPAQLETHIKNDEREVRVIDLSWVQIENLSSSVGNFGAVTSAGGGHDTSSRGR